MSEKHKHTESSPEGDHLNLRADCERCFALRCVAPRFLISVDFPITKKAGQSCPNLQPDFRCGIHPRLGQQGFRGCAIYDCFGAGQKVSQITFAGRDWRQAPTTAKQMSALTSEADLRGTDLTGSLFLIQSQLDAAKGDRDTKLPLSLNRPKHW